MEPNSLDVKQDEVKMKMKMKRTTVETPLMTTTEANYI